MASIIISRGNTLPDTSAKSDFHNLVDLASASISNIVNADISGSAAIVASKLDLSSIAQNIVMTNKAINYAQGSNIASATTTDIGAATGNYVVVTGTTTITGLGTVQAGTVRFVEFSGALTLTHNATSLILPTAANITTAAGDTAIFVSEGSGNWRCILYQKTDGTSLGNQAATQAQMEAASSTSTYVSPGRTQYHPGVAKVWAVFDGSAANPITPAASYGVSGTITKNGTGDYTVTFSTAFSSANYAVILTAVNTSVPMALMLTGTYTKNTGSFRFVTNRIDNGTTVDAHICNLVIFGDQ